MGKGKGKGEEICCDLWSSKPKSMSINHLCPTFHKITAHTDTF